MVHNKHGCFPCKFACSFPLESDNSSEDELPFAENILQGGYKQDEEKEEETIGDVWVSVIAHEK